MQNELSTTLNLKPSIYDLKNIYGYKLKLLRLHKGLSQMDIEMGTGISPGVLSRIENDKLQPNIQTLAKIINYLKLSAEQLYFLFTPLMEPKKYIFVKNKDYQEFVYSSFKTNRIRLFWINILHSMPELLHKETKRKPTNLILKKEKEVKGAKPFKFETLDASPRLREYLEQYAVFVEEAEKGEEEIRIRKRKKVKSRF